MTLVEPPRALRDELREITPQLRNYLRDDADLALSITVLVLQEHHELNMRLLDLTEHAVDHLLLILVVFQINGRLVLDYGGLCEIQGSAQLFGAALPRVDRLIRVELLLISNGNMRLRRQDLGVYGALLC